MIEKQIELEMDMLDAGIARYHRINTTAEQAGRASETSYAQRLMPNLCIELAEAIENAKVRKGKPGPSNKYLGLLQQIDSNQAAYITLKVIFDSLIRGSTLTSLASKLGQRIEDQIRFLRFAEEHSKYYNRIIDDFKRKNTVSYRHQHRVLVRKANEKEDGWNDWTPPERVHLGVKLIELTVLSTGIIEKSMVRTGKKITAHIKPTEETLEWINEHTSHQELLHPETGPCIIPPKDWVSLDEGGFYTPELQRRIPFVKTRDAEHYSRIKDGDFSRPMKACNAMQKTPWKVNTEVHDVLKEVWRRNLGIGMPQSQPIEIPSCPFPPEKSPQNMNEQEAYHFLKWKREAAQAYSTERERVAKSIQLSRVFLLAERYRQYAQFYFVYNTDFRGRYYAASPGFSPQGADFAKGVLHFAIPKALGETGSYWLAVHGANVYGYDKDSYDGRVRWVDEHRDAILAVSKNPLGSAERAFWSDADKPYQFLAFCYEWAGYLREGNEYKSHIAVALDGSCNGLQNFSAMLRDSVGGDATNLRSALRPQDIYQRVADVATDKLRCLGTELSKEILEFGITRKLAKKPVMTLPYGSTKSSCREYIQDYINASDQTLWDINEVNNVARVLTNVIWESIGEVVIAARAAMDWLQRSARLIAKEDLPLQWTTPTGFVVYQGIVKYDLKRVQTQLCGRLTLQLGEPTKEIDVRRQCNGVSPNLVHSFDASHLVFTIEEGTARGIENWAMIHDSYGTYAADTPLLAESIREGFCGLYHEKDVLGQWKNEQEERTGVELEDRPPFGNLNILEVKEAAYFFG